MRLRRVIVRAALIAVLTAVAVPALASSRSPATESALDPSAFEEVGVSWVSGTSTMALPPDDAYRLDTLRGREGLPGPAIPASDVEAPPTPVAADSPAQTVPTASHWHLDPDVSWYGPDFYGRRTACGQLYTTTILGVANRTLPCGTLVTFRNPVNGRSITVPVIDRGPYVTGRQWDLSGATCLALDHCWTGELLWRLP